MKAAKILLLVSLLTICAIPTLVAQEIGVDSTTSADLSQKVSLNFNLGEQLALWWTVPMDKNGSVFKGRGHIGVALSVPENQAPAGILSGDLDAFLISIQAPKPTAELVSLKFDLGRLAMRDSSGLILNHAADGASLDFNFQKFKVNLAAAYTGLILRNASSLSVSRYDEALAARPAFDPNPTSFTGSRRLIANAGLSIPDILKQDLELSFLMQQDLNPAELLAKEYQTSLAVGGPVNTQYAIVQLGGPIVDRLFYTAWFSYGFGSMLSWLPDAAVTSGFSYRNTAISSAMGGFKLDWFVPAFLNSAFGARFILASGDADSSSAAEGNGAELATQFVPLTPVSLGTVFSPKLSNLVFGELSASIKPAASLRLQTGLKLMTFLRPTNGAIGASGISPTSTSPYLGTELDIFGAYRILSDLGVSLNGGIFFPGIDPNGAFNTSLTSRPVQFALQLALTLGM